MNATRRSSILGRTVLAAMAVAALAFASSTEANTIQFDQNIIEVEGTISFDGGGVGVGTVSGTGIEFDRVIGFATPFNSGSPLICLGCELEFQSGTVTSISNPAAGIFIYTFGAGGTVSMTGQIAPAPGAPPHPGNPAPVDIVSMGSFDFATLSITGSTFTFSGKGTDIKDDLLVEYYFGLGANDPPIIFTHSNTELGGTGSFGPGNAFTTSNLTLADFSNTVPEPSTTAVFLLGLTAVLVRKRRG